MHIDTSPEAIQKPTAVANLISTVSQEQYSAAVDASADGLAQQQLLTALGSGGRNGDFAVLVEKDAADQTIVKGYMDLSKDNFGVLTTSEAHEIRGLPAPAEALRVMSEQHAARLAAAAAAGGSILAAFSQGRVTRSGSR